MTARVNFKIRDIEDTVSSPDMTYESISLSEYKTLSGIYDNEDNRNTIEEPEVEAKQENKQIFPSSITKNNNSNPQDQEELSEEEYIPPHNTSTLRDLSLKEKKDKYMKSMPPSMRMTAEELEKARREAVDRYIPRGCLSQGLSGIRKDLAEATESFLRLTLNKNQLVDDYFYIDKNRRDKISLKIDEEYEKKHERELKIKEGKIKEIASELGDMKLKPEDKNELDDIFTAIKLKKENPDFDKSLMNKEEKKFCNDVLKPISVKLNKMKEEKGIDEFNSYKDFTDEDLQMIEDTYNKSKIKSLEKENNKNNYQGLSLS